MAIKYYQMVFANKTSHPFFIGFHPFYTGLFYDRCKEKLEELTKYD